MKVLIDTNVVLDILLERSEWIVDAEGIWQASRDGRLTSHVSASSITDVYYISRRLTNPENARNIVRRCLDELRIVAVTSDELETAYAFGGSDFEDDLQVACAVAVSLDAIVTRDPKGFPLSPIPVLSPAELIARLREGSSDDV